MSECDTAEEPESSNIIDVDLGIIVEENKDCNKNIYTRTQHTTCLCIKKLRKCI
ncbi:hypothetical protein THOM_0467 [Trachipleistophora hominis]|uniref:Uncharacterized protein n=1 Tax=Trachipleistophora hominis TaxID=72359 RepID=L7JYP2_TRAHO|nr:hypothetical protein THOM_0467 [Trachipleistophora hominis]